MCRRGLSQCRRGEAPSQQQQQQPARPAAGAGCEVVEVALTCEGLAQQSSWAKQCPGRSVAVMLAVWVPLESAAYIVSACDTRKPGVHMTHEQV
jgi:hypothetical protein